MLEPLYTAAEMKQAEAGHDVEELMARAGRAVAEEAMGRFPDARRFVAVCGGGANGGDGRIAVEVLQAAGRAARVAEDASLDGADVVIDALFGTGFHGEPRDEAARTIEAINAARAPVVSVDLPSGVDASTGEVAGACVDAALTVTFHGLKVGLVIAPGRFHAGEVVVADIGLEPLETEHRLVPRNILQLVPRKRPGDNKYSAGTALVVGGSPGLTGAPCLAAEAAFRADAGYVAVAVPRSTLPVFEQRLLEAVKLACPEEEGLISPRAIDAIAEFAAKADAVAIGPGLGRGAGPNEVVRRLLAQLEPPIVVDADGLFELQPFERSGPTVLTPHEGELARLLGKESSWVAAHRLEAARLGATTFGAVCLLKGADTIVAAPGVGVLVSALGSPALATAGSGDVLTGIVVAFLAKGLEPRLAAAAAAAAQGVASTLVPQAGAVASDVLRKLPQALLAGSATPNHLVQSS
jgi:NAD(P)H-hydrate epimerase